MFGTAPLSYKDSSVRVHPLPMADGVDKRSFLFTKIFTVDDVDPHRPMNSPSSTTTYPSSLASSYGSTSALPEYPFPTMTPIVNTIHSINATRAPNTAEMDREGAPVYTRSSRNSLDQPARHHARGRSGTIVMTRMNTGLGTMSEAGDVAPHMPFTRVTDTNLQGDSHPSGWLPSPGPSIRRRRQSIDSARDSTPGSTTSYLKYESPICALGIIFSVPGQVLDGNECTVMNKYWQMLIRATYALQRVVLREIEIISRGLTVSGAAHSRHARDLSFPKEKPQIYRRGKKCLIDLGSGCLNSKATVTKAVTNFRTRLFGAVNLPDIVRKPLQYEADMLVTELTSLLDVLDRQEYNYIISALLSHISRNLQLFRNNISRVQDGHRNNMLEERLLIVSDDAVLARKLIFCLARLLFREHNDHLDSTVDFALIWPVTGLLGVSSIELSRRKQANIARALVSARGWDIPSNQRPLSLGAYAVSPSIHNRPPSTASTSSSRPTSWKPSWWSSIASRAQISGDDNLARSAQSDTTTTQTSWSSADFRDLTNSGNLESWSRSGRDPSLSPRPDSEVATEEDFGVEAHNESSPSCQLDVRLDENGIVEVASLQTSACISDIGQGLIDRSEDYSLNFPLTGVISRFHPDMLLQCIPKLAYDDAQLKAYLAEEDSYLEDSATTNDDSWSSTASITIAELGSSCRLRRLTRLTRALPPTDFDDLLEWDPEGDALPLCEEKWQDENLTEVDDKLLSVVQSSLKTYRETRNVQCVQQIIDSFSTCKSTGYVVL